MKLPNHPATINYKGFMRACFFGVLLSISLTVSAQLPKPPTSLRTDLLLHTDKVWSNGFLTNLTLEAADSSGFSGQRALIRSTRPSFSWVLSSTDGTSRQTAYRLIVSSSRKNSQANQGDVWDSGKVVSNQSTGILLPADYQLDTNRIYFWKVNSWNDRNVESGFSQPESIPHCCSVDYLRDTLLPRSQGRRSCPFATDRRREKGGL